MIPGTGHGNLSTTFVVIFVCTNIKWSKWRSVNIGSCTCLLSFFIVQFIWRNKIKVTLSLFLQVMAYVLVTFVFFINITSNAGSFPLFQNFQLHHWLWLVSPDLVSIYGYVGMYKHDAVLMVWRMFDILAHLVSSFPGLGVICVVRARRSLHGRRPRRRGWRQERVYRPTPLTASWRPARLRR